MPNAARIAITTTNVRVRVFSPLLPVVLLFSVITDSTTLTNIINTLNHLI
jgi:hypothetical protein